MSARSAARAQLSRRARRASALARDLAGAVLPRADDGDARAHGTAGTAGAADPYLPEQPHIPPSTWRFDPTGERALAALDAALEHAGPETVAAFFCEVISAAALPAYMPPPSFWEGFAERRERYGFLICFDEVVTGIGRTGRWFASDKLRSRPTSSRPPRGSARATRRSARRSATTASTRPSPRARAASRSVTRGTGRRSRAPSGSPCSTR